MIYRQKLLITLVLSVFSFAENSEAKPLKIQSERGIIEFSGQLLGWKYLKDVFGMENLFLKKSSKGKQSTISITMTGQKLELVGSALHKRILDYEKGRKKWAKKKNLKISSFEKFKNFENKNGIRFYLVGLNYSTPSLGKVHERSLYINCKDNSLIHSKFILLNEHLKYQKDIIEFFQTTQMCTQKKI